MEVWIVPIAVALIGGPLAVLMKRFDTRNTEQHAENKAVLDLVLKGQDRIEAKVDRHIEWHAENPIPQKDIEHAR